MFDMSRYYGRVVHLRQLPTSCRHDAVAFGYRRVNVPPDGDLHPAVCTPSQAHERGLQSAGRLINEQGWGIVQRVLSELTFRRNKFRAPKIVAVRDDLDR